MIMDLCPEEDIANLFELAGLYIVIGLQEGESRHGGLDDERRGLGVSGCE